MFRNTVARARKLLRARVIYKEMHVSAFQRGYDKWHSHSEWRTSTESDDATNVPNSLRTFFNEHKSGPGIWKFDHYFDIYERHFSRFRGRAVNVLELGVYSGGSLQMWEKYFGSHCQILGVDIEPDCKAYESDCVKVFIGNQGDRTFWGRFREQVPNLDIVIDDCSHQPEDQIVSFEELFPHLRSGGVYLCEDITHVLNPFASYLYGFAHNLNALDGFQNNVDDKERRQVCRATPFQSAIGSIHFYPYVTVVERTVAPISEFVAPKHGTQWQPFLK